MPLSTIFQLYRSGQFLFVEDTGVPGKNLPPAASHWQSLSNNVLSTPTPSLNEIQTPNFSSD